MKRIFINAISARTGGTFTYLTNIVPKLLDIAGDFEYTLICGTDQIRFTGYLSAHCQVEIIQVPVPKTSNGRAIWQQTHLPLLLRDIEFDLFFSPNNFTVLSLPDTVSVVLAIRNPNPFYQVIVPRNLTGRLANFAIRKLAKLSARKARRVIFVSDHSRQVISKRIDIPASKTRVVYHGRSEMFKPSTSPTKEFMQPFILSVSNIYPHKNYARLVEAFAILKREFGIPHRLVIIGKHGKKSEMILLYELVKEKGLSEVVQFPGTRSYQELPAIYAAADIFVLPSILETFGHPLVEAMASGVPLAASNAASNPEICNGSAILFDPFDIKAMAEAMYQLIEGQGECQKLVEQGLKRALFFSWEKSAANLHEIFREILD